MIPWIPPAFSLLVSIPAQDPSWGLLFLSCNFLSALLITFPPDGDEYRNPNSSLNAVAIVVVIIIIVLIYLAVTGKLGSSSSSSSNNNNNGS